MSAGVFLFVFVINLVLDFVGARAFGSSTIGYVIGDAVTALIATLLLLRSITLHNERHEAVRRQLSTVAEMNHHVRNALDAIRMSAELTQDQDAISVISGEVDRIQWALRVAGGTAVLATPSPKWIARDYFTIPNRNAQIRSGCAFAGSPGETGVLCV